ncbi:hypothetical protein BCR44DRAFT_34102 [Catenaria anguillulae PL171]|uniref:Uncharacterized protein n=1 Tax=Catenaria anguillulae PL171 TaxID=765915 RepID=A0A1Y2HUL0_9FUNG|nr:hypothetical protein BCR44DRAFT_34102 [Catenaria anguillulae PL171]
MTTQDPPQHGEDTMAVPLTLTTLPADVLNVLLDRIIRRHRHPAADLASLALTCHTVAQVVIPALYETIVVPTLPSLPLLDRTLTARADLAARVKILALGNAFLDGTQFDLSVGLSDIIKTVDGLAVANEDRIKFLGPDTQRSLIMAWMTHFAKRCPNLTGVDFSRTGSLPSGHALGFTNLAQVLRPRSGWFKPPSRGDFYVAAAPIRNSTCSTRKVGMVTAIHWGTRTINLLRSPIRPHFLNLSQLHDLIPGDDSELSKWTVRHHVLVEDEWNKSDTPGVLSQVYGVRNDSFGFGISQKRLPAAASCSISMETLANAISLRDIHGVAPCTSLSIANPYLTADSPPTMGKQHFRDFVHNLGLLKSSPWTTVTSLSLGAPLFMRDNWLDSLHQLAMIATAFPNVTSLSLQAYYPAIGDVLLACDPFLRRAHPFGRPLQQLGITRNSPKHKLAELQSVPTDPSMLRTLLKVSRASPHHLYKLIILDMGLADYHRSWRPRPILIHPGLLHGLKHANFMGTHVAVAPPRLAMPASASFPSILALGVDEQPLSLAHITLPNMQLLSLNGDLTLPNPKAATATSLVRALPKCPNLESLMIDLNQYICITSWQAAASIICKYPRLRNVCLACVRLDRNDLLALIDYLFVHPVRALRPVPMLGRVVLVNDYRKAKELEGIWVAGPDVGTVWMSDVKIPGEFHVVSSCPYTETAKARGTLHLCGVPIPWAEKPCLCGRVKMGEPGTWIYPGTGRVLEPVVCDMCCGRMDERLRSNKSGVELRCINPDIEHYPMLIYEGLWPAMRM